MCSSQITMFWQKMAWNKTNIGKYSETYIKLKKSFVICSLVECTLKTGRTHQLRIHMSSIGFPILGDKIYGELGNILAGKGLFLCALELVLKHPVTNEPLTIKTETPYKFISLLDREAKRWGKFQWDNNSIL